MDLVKDISILSQLIESCFKKGTLTNNYLMTGDFDRLVGENRLYLHAYNNNVLLLVRYEGFYRQYYYLNDLTQYPALNIPDPVVMEIIFRGIGNQPSDETAYWQASGFCEHLTRDNMFARFEQMTLPENYSGQVNIRYANESDAGFIHLQLTSSLDKYTGDQLNMNQVTDAIHRKNILVAAVGGKSAGFLRFEHRNGVVWLGHIVVDKNFRGEGVAKSLVGRYIVDNMQGAATRYQLWVINHNEGAVNLYRKFGFQYNNKSTLSLLKA